MDGPPTLLDDDLAAQTTVLLPARETLLTINVAPVIGVNEIQSLWCLSSCWLEHSIGSLLLLCSYIQRDVAQS
jgi:hypothetical protein